MKCEIKMKMPEKIDTIMFAPCGMNCKLCIKHLSENNSCPGCLIDSPNKTKNALKCKIKKCLETKEWNTVADAVNFHASLLKSKTRTIRKDMSFPHWIMLKESLTLESIK